MVTLHVPFAGGTPLCRRVAVVLSLLTPAAQSDPRPLPQRLPLPTVFSAQQVVQALQWTGAVSIGPGAVDNSTVAYLDGWLLDHAERLLPHIVRQPHERRHVLLLLGDAGGAVGEAVAAIVRALRGVLPAGSALAELGAFIVSAGAPAQELHADRYEAGFLSCQLALHDTPSPAAGGLALWPGTVGDQRWDEAGRLEAGGLLPQLLGTPQERGAVTCYDGRLWHRGDRHSGIAETRRVMYFTAALLEDDTATVRLDELAIHPRLRCAPRRVAPLLRLWAHERNTSAYTSLRRHCTSH